MSPDGGASQIDPIEPIPAGIANGSCGASSPIRGVASDWLQSADSGHRLSGWRPAGFNPACAKTCASQECGEWFFFIAFSRYRHELLVFRLTKSRRTFYARDERLSVRTASTLIARGFHSNRTIGYAMLKSWLAGGMGHGSERVWSA